MGDPGADVGHIGAHPKQGFHGIDDDRFARAGFTGKNCQTRAKLQFNFIYNCKVFNPQF